MLRKEVEYVDFNGKQQKEVLYFNLTEPEVVRLDVKFPGGLEKYVEALDPEENPQKVLDLFEEVIKASYGEKSEDGKYFVKDEERVSLFFGSAAYSSLFMELIQDADTAAAFFNALLTKTTVDKD